MIVKDLRIACLIPWENETESGLQEHFFLKSYNIDTSQILQT